MLDTDSCELYGFADSSSIVREQSAIIRPTKRILVTDFAEREITIATPRGYSGPVDLSVFPYMREPMECLTDPRYQSVVFVGPAQCAKTFCLAQVYVAYLIACDPSDVMIIDSTVDAARDFSIRKMDRLLDSNPALKDQLLDSPDADNIFDKRFRSGMIASIGWPSKTILAGKAIGKMILTDYDRWPDDIGGEGSGYQLAVKRMQTFMRQAKCAVESSPGRIFDDPEWQPSTPHEAPPVGGILGLFNIGDRRRLYFRCAECRGYWLQPHGLEGFWFDEVIVDIGKKAATVSVPCRICGFMHRPSMRKRLIAESLWLAEGETIDDDGVRRGEPIRSNIASFWLPGAAAAFQKWESILSNHLAALDQFEKTGRDEALKNCMNLDHGAPHIPPRVRRKRSSIDQSGLDHWPHGKVPDGVRYLIATIDVQGSCFKVLTTGWGVDSECWIIDRYDISISDRLVQGSPTSIDPGNWPDDWNALIDGVIAKQFERGDGSRFVPVGIACDSAGQPGVTINAYHFWRFLRVRYPAFVRRFNLIKGTPKPIQGMVRQTWPDNRKKGGSRKSGARGDIPVWLIDVNQAKDVADMHLSRTSDMPGFIHFPAWLDPSFFRELVAEERGKNGWERIGNQQNHAFDLLGYSIALNRIIGADTIDWLNPPTWAQDSDMNPYRIPPRTDLRTEPKSMPTSRPKRFRFDGGLE